MPTFARARIMDRLERLEERIRPPQRAFVFYSIEPDPRPRAERLAEFRAENNVGPNDVVHSVRYVRCQERQSVTI
jgi:hypothetical protein